MNALDRALLRKFLTAKNLETFCVQFQVLYGTKYSRMDQGTFVESSL